jgi:hypothetical protein
MVGIESGVKRVGMVQQFERWIWFAFALLAQVKRRARRGRRQEDGRWRSRKSIALRQSGGGLILRSTFNVHNDNVE